MAESSNTHSSISPDGRFVAFQSDSNQLVKGDTGHVLDVFVRDLSSSRIAKVSVGLDGEEVDGPSGASSTAVSAGGREVVFDSQAHNLVEGPANPSEDLYLKSFGNN